MLRMSIRPCSEVTRTAIDRAYTVQREQERLRKSLGKYNNFVREKAAKVEDGDRLYAEEVEFQESIEQRIREKTNLVQELEGAKVSGEDGIIIRLHTFLQNLIDSAVERRAIFRRYLDTVVEEERANRNRCTISLAAICKSQPIRPQRICSRNLDPY